MRLRPAGGLDPATGALIMGGGVLIAASLAAAASRPSLALAADRVAVVLSVDAGAGAGSAARAGDHVDLLGYFSRQVSGSENVTRLLLQEVPVLTIDRSGATVALTLAVSQDAALLLQEAQALGVRPFITLRAANTGSAPAPVASLTDADLIGRLVGAR